MKGDQVREESALYHALFRGEKENISLENICSWNVKP